MSSTPQWRRTQFAVVVGVFVYFSGMNVVMPFLPLYVQQLEGVDLARATLWSGLILAAAPLVSGTVAPLWGMLADRYGAKLMLLRAMLAFIVCLALMGIATAAWQLLVLRLGMGLLAGFGSAAAALISANSPREHLTAGLGKMHSARVLGLALGPLLGGVLADALGYRAACFASAVLGMLAFAVAALFVRPGAVQPHIGGRGAPRVPAGTVLGTPAFLSVLFVVLTSRLIERTFDPVLPLLVASRQATGGLGIATAAAVIASAGLLAAAASAALAGRIGARLAADRRLRVAVLVMLVGLLGMSVAGSFPALLALRVLIGAALGIAVTLAYATIAAETPRQRHGLALSVLGTGSSYGASIGLVLAGVLSAVALPLVFAVDGVLAAAVVVVHLMVRRRR